MYRLSNLTYNTIIDEREAITLYFLATRKAWIVRFEAYNCCMAVTKTWLMWIIIGWFSSHTSYWSQLTTASMHMSKERSELFLDTKKPGTFPKLGLYTLVTTQTRINLTVSVPHYKCSIYVCFSENYAVSPVFYIYTGPVFLFWELVRLCGRGKVYLKGLLRRYYLVYVRSTLCN